MNVNRSVVMISLMPHLARSQAGMATQSAPAAAAATNISESRAIIGRETFRPIQVPAMAPMNSCPSAPMFHNWAFSGRYTASPAKISGTAFATVSVSPNSVVSVRRNMVS
jgi:hypothetical protein